MRSSRAARHCRCTRENNPCGWCARDIDRAEIERIDPQDDGGTERAERMYERWLDEIGGSR